MVGHWNYSIVSKKSLLVKQKYKKRRKQTHFGFFHLICRPLFESIGMIIHQLVKKERLEKKNIPGAQDASTSRAPPPCLSSWCGCRGGNVPVLSLYGWGRMWKLTWHVNTSTSDRTRWHRGWRGDGVVEGGMRTWRMRTTNWKSTTWSCDLLRAGLNDLEFFLKNAQQITWSDGWILKNVL